MDSSIWLTVLPLILRSLFAFAACFTDIGMLATQTHTGLWNTNNFTEAAFKTFDKVMLEYRENKQYVSFLLDLYTKCNLIVSI